MEPKIIEKILSLYANGATFREIEKKLRLPEGLVFRTVQQHATPKIREQHNKNAIARQENKVNVHIDAEKIFKELESGKQLHKIVDEYGISYNIIVDRVKEYAEMHGIKEINGLNLEDILKGKNINKGRPSKRKIDVPLEKIIEDWKSGKKIQEIADEYGVCANVIYQRLRNSGVNVKRGRKRSKTHVNNVPIEVLVEEFANGKSYSQLAKKYEIPTSTIWNYIRRHEEENGKIIKNNVVEEKESAPKEDKVQKKRTRQLKTKEHKIDNIWKEYTNGVPISELAIRYKIPDSTLKTQLKTYQDYLITKAYVEQNKSIAAISRETQLPFENVKQRVVKVLRQNVPLVDTAWYLITRSKGYTEEETLKLYMLKQKQKVKYNQERKAVNER